MNVLGPIQQFPSSTSEKQAINWLILNIFLKTNRRFRFPTTWTNDSDHQQLNKIIKKKKSQIDSRAYIHIQSI